MAPLDRRSLLRSLGTIAAGLVTGCNAGPDQSPSSPTPEPTGPTPTDARRSPDTPTDSGTGTETPAPAFSGDPGPLPDATWPLPYRGGTNGSYLPDGPRLGREPAVDWRIEEPVEGDPDYFDPRLTHPVIADGRLYTTKQLTHGPNQAAPDQHYLVSFDAATGTERWQQPIRPGPAFKFPTAPALRGDMVYVGHDRRLRAHGTETGEERWRRDLGEPIHGIRHGPDRTYIRAHRSVYAVDGEGTVSWATDLDEFPGALALGPKNVYTGASRRLVALDPGTGDRRWERTLPATSAYAIRRLVTAEGGVFVLQHSGDLSTFDDTGRPAWPPDGSYGSISTDGERLYAGGADGLRAFAVATGKRLWELSCPDLEGCGSARFVGKPAVTDGVVYVPIEGDILAAVDPRDGTATWTTTTERNVPRITLGMDAIYTVGDHEQSITRWVAPGNRGQ